MRELLRDGGEASLPPGDYFGVFASGADVEYVGDEGAVEVYASAFETFAVFAPRNVDGRLSRRRGRLFLIRHNRDMRRAYAARDLDSDRYPAEGGDRNVARERQR